MVIRDIITSSYTMLVQLEYREVVVPVRGEDTGDTLVIQAWIRGGEPGGNVWWTRTMDTGVGNSVGTRGV